MISENPESKARAVFDQFLATFSAASSDKMAAIFAPDVLFWGTTRKTLATKNDELKEYFSDLDNRKVGEFNATPVDISLSPLSEKAVMISGLWQMKATGEETPVLLRVSMVIGYNGERWEIVQFHNSRVPE